MDEVDDGVAAQDLARGWEGGNRASDRGRGPEAAHFRSEWDALTATHLRVRRRAGSCNPLPVRQSMMP